MGDLVVAGSCLVRLLAFQGAANRHVFILRRPRGGGNFCPYIEPRRQQNESRQISRRWLESSTDHKYCSCGTHNMFRWDPRGFMRYFCGTHIRWDPVANMASYAISSSLILVIHDNMIIETNLIVLACLCRHF
jgi:hypothetical protein